MLDRGPSPPSAKEFVLGTFGVSTKPEQVKIFASATGGAQTEVPAAFPATWLSIPELRQALSAAVGPDHVPVHEFQSFDYSMPLRCGADYYMFAVAIRETAPDRIVINADIVSREGVKALTMRSALRIVPLTKGPVA
jgi:hypothetical protein